MIVPRSNFSRALIAGLALLAATSRTIAQSTGDASSGPAPDPHAFLIPQRLLWPGVAVIIVAAIFVTAALAGPLIRANQRDEEP